MSQKDTYEYLGKISKNVPFQLKSEIITHN